MSLDEYLFGVFSNYLKKRKQKAIAQRSETVKLEEIKGRLTILANAITGEPIKIFPAEREGGYKNNNFFLPPYFGEFPTVQQNFNFYIFRVLYLSVQKKLKLNYPQNKNATLEQAREDALKTSPKVLKELFKEFQPLKELFQEFKTLFEQKAEQNKEPVDFTYLFGKWMHQADDDHNDELENFDDRIKKAQDQKVDTILKTQTPVEELKTVQLDKKQQEDQVVHNYFEKIETLEEHEGGIWKDFDGDDEMDEHKNALDELKLKNTIRVDEETHSVYQTEFIENINIAESKEINPKNYYLSYDEWDYSQRKYKRDFCKLYPKTLKETDTVYYQDTIKKNALTLKALRKMLTNLNNRYKEQRRQAQGDDFDIDALTDYVVDVKTGHTPSEKIYLSKRKQEKDISILLLLDVSLSSDGYAAGNRIIDVEKQVSILFGEILAEFNVDFSIDAFFSKTRNYSTYVSLKSFDEDWNRAKHRLGAIQPQGYTRIGTALRHSGSLLEKRETKSKWIILLSDGKPNDYDRYEGRYGINDVKQALYELKGKQINSYALAVEAQAKYYLPVMFGQNHYQILTTPVELLDALVKLFDKIRR